MANEPAFGAALKKRTTPPGLLPDNKGRRTTQITITESPVIIEAQAPAAVAFLFHKPYKKGAMKLPANAPQDKDIKVTMALGFDTEMIKEAATKSTQMMRIKFTSNFLDMFL